MGAPGPSGIGPLVLAVVRPDGDAGRRQDPSKRRPSKGGQHEGNGVQTRTRGEGSIRVARTTCVTGPVRFFVQGDSSRSDALAHGASRTRRARAVAGVRGRGERGLAVDRGGVETI